ncbi:unnamed protein product [Urochloa humidicola]
MGRGPLVCGGRIAPPPDHCEELPSFPTGGRAESSPPPESSRPAQELDPTAREVNPPARLALLRTLLNKGEREREAEPTEEEHERGSAATGGALALLVLS